MPTSATEEETSPRKGRRLLHPWRGYFFIAAATFCWGAAAAAGKAIFSGRVFAGRAPISPLVLSQARTSFAVILLAGFLLLDFGTRFFRINRRDLLLCVLTGTLGLAGSNYFYYLAIEKSSVAIAITLQYTAPVWVLITMVLRGRERFTFRRVSAVILALGGIALAINVFHSGLSLKAMGVLGGIIASFSYAFYNIVAQELVSRHHQFKIMFYALLAATILWILVNPPQKLAAEHFTGAQWSFLFLFACLSTLLPYFFYFTGLKYLDPTRAIIASCLEPVFAILFAVSFVGEVLRPVQVAGIAAVLLATVMVQVQWPDSGRAEQI
ncbi:MAG TPA: EamA family transporter [Candidatus Angelobacter sp.]|nr:EamA family transporter [Candidatus Angelobacter sp.]